MTINIGDECTECHRDTSFGSGLFVNRFPFMECVMCSKLSLDYGSYEGQIVCDDCNPELIPTTSTNASDTIEREGKNA